MIKKLPTNDIANELAGSSVFLQPQAPSGPAPRSPEAHNKPTPATEAVETPPPSDASTHQSRNHATVVLRLRDTTVASHQDSKQPLNDEQTAIANLGEICKSVKQLGKEAATYRFRAEEKIAIADIVNTYTHQRERDHAYRRQLAAVRLSAKRGEQCAGTAA